jgi:hypothetical protein
MATVPLKVMSASSHNGACLRGFDGVGHSALELAAFELVISHLVCDLHDIVRNPAQYLAGSLDIFGCDADQHFLLKRTRVPFNAGDQLLAL